MCPTWTSLSDDTGKIRFENLPVGDYSLLAYTETAGTAEAAYVDESSPADTSNNMVLMPLVQMRGSVVNSEGQPVANATIYPVSHELSGNDFFNTTRVAATRVTSGEDGAYTFDRCWPGKMRFFVAAEGYAPLVSEWVQTSDSPTFTLAPGGTIDLTLVREPGGEPLAGVQVVLSEPDSGRIGMEGTTGPDGRIHFEHVSPGVYFPELNDAALVLIDNATISMAALEQKVITLRMGAGATIYGKVFETDTQEPLPGMVVYARGGANIEREAITADDGTYMLTGVPGGAVYVGVSGVAGNSMRHYGAGATGFLEGTSAQRQISVSPGTTLEDVNFDMRRALVVSGRVVDESGAPVAGADVDLRPVECNYRSQFVRHGETDDFGAFKFASLPLDCTFEIFARSATGISKMVPVVPTAATEIVVTVLPGGVFLAGEVRTPEGNPINYGSVSLAYPNNVVIAEEIRSGRVEFGMVPIGIASYTMYYGIEQSGARYGCPPVEIVLPAGKRLSDHQFTCGEPGDLTISGRVLLPDGAPAGGAEVALMQLPLKTTTDAQGAFTLEGIGENDNYSVQATLQGYSAAAQFQAKGGDDDITLQLRPLVQLAGRVLDAASGVPIQGAKIELQQYTNGLQVPVNTKSAADGGFAFENRSMGSFNIHTTAPGYADNSHSFHISENTEIPAMVIKLTPPVRVAGVVLDPSGVPLAGATLEAAQGRIRTISNTDGSFDLHGLESGVATALKVSHTDHGRITLEVVPGSPGTEDLTITMPVPPTLEVIATLDGAPLPSYDVNGMSMVPSGNSFYTRANSPDGRVTAREVSAGTWNINIRHDGGGGTEINQVVEFSGGQVTTVTAAFQTGTSSLQGKFSSPFGPSGMQRHAHLKNLDEGRTGYPVHIEPDNYSVENIAPGNYVLIIFGGETGFQRIQRLVRIAEGEAKEFDIILDGSASVAFTRSGNLEENFIVTLTNSENAPDPAELERSGSLTPTDSDNYTLPIPAGASTGSLSGLAPGDYWLYAGPMSRMVVPPGGTAPEPVYQSVQIAPGDANEFEVGG